MALRIEPVTPDRWDDLETLFGPNGAYSGCWCTWWLWTGRGFEQRTRAERRAELKRRVDEGMEPGLLAYDAGEPVGWVAIAPRDRYARFTSPRARTFRPIDGRASWVVSCFYVRRDRRGGGVGRSLLEAVGDFVRERGGDLVEGYPVESDRGQAAAFTGTAEMFSAAGYAEAARFNGRPLVRLELSGRAR